MLRTNTVLNAAVAGVLLLPTLSLTGDRATNLQRSLEETVVALESLAGLRDELPARLQGPPEARRGTVGAVLGSTERPITDARVRDTMLATLRDDVGRLQMDLDRLRQKKQRAALGGETTGTPDAAAGTDALPGAPAAGERPLIVVPTVGLDSAQREGLSTLARPAGTDSVSERRDERAPRHSEGEDFSADRLRQGQALYRAGRFDEALATLERAGDAVEPAYWRARCLERLGRSDEALAAYQAIVAREDAGAFAERAASDIEFLTWKREFGRRIDARGAEKSE